MKRYIIPAGLSWLLFILGAIFLIGLEARQESDVLFYISLCGAVSCTLVFSLVSTLGWRYRWPNRPAPRWGYFFVPLGIALCFVWLQAVPQIGYRVLYISGLCAAGSAASVAILSRQYGEGLWNYLCWAGLKCLALGGVICVALGLCLLAWNVLLFPLPGLMPFVIFHLAFGVVAFMAFLSYIPQGAEEVTASPLFGAVLYKALYPVYAVYILILYAYIVLIFSRGALPVGQMNWFASIALGGYVFFYMTSRAYTNQRLLSPYLRYGGLLLLPILASQIWCVYIRFDAYGLTPLRYLSMACTLFAVIVIVGALRFIRNSWLAAIAAAFSLILSVSPWNVYDVPYTQQVHRLYQELVIHDMVKDGHIVVGEPLSDTASDQVASAYEYIRQHHEGHDDLQGNAILRSTVLKDIALVQKSHTVTYYAKKGKPIAVGAFSKLYPIDAVTENGVITVDTEDGKKSFYLEDYANILLDTYPDTYFVDDLSFEADETHVLYFKNITITMDGRKEPAISAHGYLLVR